MTCSDEKQRLAAEIARLEKTTERMEKLGLTAMSGGGVSRTFANYETLRRRLSQLRHRLKALSDGKDPQIVHIQTVVRG